MTIELKKVNMMTLRIALLLMIMILVSACSASGGDDPAATVVESYLQAKVDNDEDGIRSLICSELESEIENEAISFASVESSIEDMSCTSDGNVVSCTGQIVAVYGTENREFPLTSYHVVEEDGEWRWCGVGQ